MSKYLIATRANSGIKEMCDLTHPLLKKYAEKCKADFSILDKDIEGLHSHWRILNLFNLFERYDRIAVIDSDVLILKSCPCLFTTVSENCVGSVYEDKGSRLADRQNRIQKAQQKYGSVNWISGYINTGVCIFSKQHQNLFEYKKEDLWDDLGYDDVYLGWKIKNNNYSVQELPFQWNHMSMFSESWNNNANRFDSYIIHYAGNAFYPTIDRTEQIRQDYFLLKRFGLIEVNNEKINS